MIRAQVSWWPGNVETKGGTHIHHMVWGILLLMTMGYLGLATDMGSPWLEFTGIAFGIGLGLSLDEFALWLNLQDVYWSEKGRQSIDAVIVATLMLVVAVIGLQFWIDVREAVLLAIGIGGRRFVGAESLPWLLGFQLIGIAAAVVCWLKGKRLFAIVGAFVPIIGLYGALTKSRRTRGGGGGGSRHRRIPALDHLGLALVAEHRERRGRQREQLPVLVAAGRASAP